MNEIELTSQPIEATGKTTVFLWDSFAICFLSNIAAGIISTVMPVYLPEAVQTLSGPVTQGQMASISAFISALYMLGWAIGGLLWGFIGDKAGRSRSLMLSFASLGLFTCLISYSPRWEFVVALRFLSGFSVGGILVLTPTLLSEVWPVKSRSIVIGITSIGFPIGIFSSGLITYLVTDWRQAFLVGFLPLSLAFISIWFLPESEKWKLANGSNIDRGIAVSKTDRHNLLTGSIIFSSMLIGLWGMFSWIPMWVQSLVDIGGQTERGIAMMLLGGGGLAGGFFSGWLSNSLGARKAMLFCFAGCLLMSVLLFGLHRSFSVVIYAELSLLSLFFGISQGLLSIYIPQLFPVGIRGRATGFCFNIGRFATAGAVFFVGVLVTALGGYGNTLLTFAGIFIAGFLAVYNTKNQTITQS